MGYFKTFYFGETKLELNIYLQNIATGFQLIIKLSNKRF